jgi:hypothetical protein
MGVITIEIPQAIRKKYHIRSKAKAQKILDSLDRSEPNDEDLQTPGGILANGDEAKNSSEEFRLALDSVVGMWSYRNESTKAIAKRLRAGWDRGHAG